MFASAGDGGGSCLPGANGVTNDGVPCVEYPASSPYVVGVGGTVLYTATTSATSSTQASPAARVDEYSWNYSGGGQSNFEPAPSWQVAALPAKTAVPCTVGANTGEPCRGVPDVSAQSGDIATNGYDIVSDGELTEEGGTSLSSPLWAGMWARVVAAHPQSCSTSYTGGSSALGFAQEDLYNLANDPAQDTKDFFDVGGTTDSMPSSNGQQQTLPRSTIDPTGYDYVSGLGSPDVTNITEALDCDNTKSVVADTTPASNDVTDVYDSTAGCPQDGSISDPAGDEVPATTTDEALDLTQVTLSSDTDTLAFSAEVTDLSTNPGDLDYAFEFKYGNGAYAVSADRGAGGASDTFALYSLAVTSTPIGLGVQAIPTQLADDLTGSITGNTITVMLPVMTFNSTAMPSTPLASGKQISGITTYTNNGPAATAIANDYNVEPIDQAEFFQCTYTLVAGDPTTSSPSPTATPTTSSPSPTATPTTSSPSPTATPTTSVSPSTGPGLPTTVPTTPPAPIPTSLPTSARASASATATSTTSSGATASPSTRAGSITSDTGSASPAADSGSTEASNTNLPFTGADILQLIAVAALVIAAGAQIAARARARN